MKRKKRVSQAVKRGIGSLFIVTRATIAIALPPLPPKNKQTSKQNKTPNLSTIFLPDKGNISVKQRKVRTFIISY
jgi:hypothetical protein